jgi:nitric oxide reductase subunit B
MFHQMGVVSTKTATRLIYLDAILYLSGWIIGTGHHWYFTGQGTLNMGLASCFSALEVLGPLNSPPISAECLTFLLP